ncbi:MAG: hypothetical protein HPY76_10960 [Anaerolineae bacterium]|nr:hypothetical protein [Anaerolineae bacterium]
MDPIDDIDPAADVIALYQRSIHDQLEIRLDFLMFASNPPYDIDVCLQVDTIANTRPVSTEDQTYPDDCTYGFRSHGSSQITTWHSESPGDLPSIGRSVDPVSDYVVFTLDDTLVQDTARLNAIEVRIIHPNTGEIIDRLGPFPYGTSLSQHHRANLLLEFWNTLHSPTPAALLRAWDGAHSGPYGGRHGLAHLLNASVENQVPVYLLDLKTPVSLAGMIKVQGDETIADGELGQLVILPQSTWGDPAFASQSLEIGKKLTQAYGLPISPILFSSTDLAMGNEALQFAALVDSTHLANSDHGKYIPFLGPYNPGNDSTALSFFAQQVDLQGLTLESRSAILRSAMNDDPNDLVILGGSLPDSSWGNNTGASDAFKYLRDHPWIDFPIYEDLVAMPADPANALVPTCDNLLCISGADDIVGYFPYTQSQPIYLNQSVWQADLRSRINSISNHDLRQLITLVYLQLSDMSNSTSQNLLAISHYQLIERLLRIDPWLTESIPQTTCDDFVWGTNCVIATEKYYSSFDINGGLWVFSVIKTDYGFEIFLGPSGFFTTGLGSPESWNADLGPFADPGAYPGAYMKSDLTRIYQPSWQEQSLTFTSADGIVKQFKVSDDQIIMSINDLDSELTLPILWQLAYQDTDTHFVFRTSVPPHDHSDPPTLSLTIASHDAQSSIISSWDSMNFLAEPEDPNQNYPAGHYVPFPLSILKISGGGPAVLTFDFIN